MSVSMVPVKSSNVAAVGYDREARRLAVRYTSGSTYVYDEVPDELYERLQAVIAGGLSVGSFIYREVRVPFHARLISGDGKVPA